MNYALSDKVEWVVALEFIVGGVLGGLFGTRLAIVLSSRRAALSKVFAGLVFVVALYMLYRNAQSFGLHI